MGLNNQHGCSSLRPAFSKGLEPQFVANAPESRQSFLFRALHRSGIIDTPMNAYCFRRKDGATLLRVIADRDHVVEILPFKLVHELGAVAGDVDPRLTHYGDGFRPYLGRLRARTEDLLGMSCVVAQQSLGHLASGRIARAKDEDSLGRHLRSVF